MSLEPDTQSVGGDTVHVMLRAIKADTPAPAPAPAPSPAPSPSGTRITRRVSKATTGRFPAPPTPQGRVFRRARDEQEKGLFTAQNTPILLACLAAMAFGAISGRKAMEQAPAPLPRAGGAVRERSAPAAMGGGGWGGGGSSEDGEEVPYTIYDGPLIKDPDGWYYVARTEKDLSDRFRFEPRRASRVMFHGNPPEQYVAFPRKVLVKAYPQLLVMLDLGLRLRSDYAKQTGRGAPGAPVPRLTREQMEAQTQRRLERELKTGEIYGTHYSDHDEFAPGQAEGPRSGKRQPLAGYDPRNPAANPDPRNNPDPRAKPGPKAEAKQEPDRRVWTDAKGVVRSNAPPDPKKIQQAPVRPVD